MKLVLKNCLTSIENCEWTKKELELRFSPNQFYRVQLKTVYSAVVPHLFFADIYSMESFDKICL